MKGKYIAKKPRPPQMQPSEEGLTASKHVLGRDEAREMRRLLEEYYGEPVLPLHKFCQAIETWMDCIRRNNTDPELTQDEVVLQGNKYFNHLNNIRTDIRKSNLLGRLLHAGEKLRTRMCPLHRGHWNSRAMFFEKCPHLCDGTGWLREREQDGGYTGIVIREARIERGKLEYKDPETGEWKTGLR